MDRIISRLAAAAPFLALMVLVAILLGYAGLLPLGRWQADEYLQAAFAHDFGFRYLWHRVSGSSPRPVSEAVLFFYYRLAVAAHRPLVGPFLLAHWIVLVAACLATWRRRLGIAPVWRVLAAAALLGAFIAGRQVTELFFWPAAVAPYLEVLAGLCLLLFLSLDGVDAKGGSRLAPVLITAAIAGGAETGAFFAIPFGLLRWIEARRSPCAAARRRAWRWLLPVVVAGALLTIIAASSRLTHAESVLPGSTTLHRKLASLGAALVRLGAELLQPGPGPLTFAGVAGALAEKALFFVGFRWCWAGRRGGVPAGIVAFPAALLLGAFATLAAAEYQYGGPCCEHHATLRQAEIFLAVAALSVRAAPLRRTPREAVLAACCLVLAGGIAVWPKLPQLAGDYAVQPLVTSVRARNWQAGLASGPDLRWCPMPDGRIVRSFNMPAGHTRLDDHPPWWALGVLLFFHKQDVRFGGELADCPRRT